MAVLAGLLALTAWNVTRSEALAEARRAYTRGDLAACLRAALDHLGRQPWSREAALLAARSLSRLDYADDAEPYYRRAGRLDLADLQVRAYGLVRGNHRLRAVRAYEEILARWPDNVTAMRRLAAVQMTMSNDPEVLKLAERLIRTPGGAAIGYTLRGVVRHNEKIPEEAAAAFERVLQLDPDLREMPLPRQLFWSHLGNDLLSAGRVADARRDLTRAVAAEPDAYLMTILGRAYELDGMADDAERCFRQAAELNPNYYVPYLYLGKIALYHRRRDEALGHLRRAVALAPRQHDALYALALAYRQFGLTAEANRVQQEAERSRAAPAPTSPPPPKAPLPRYAL